MVFSTSTVAFGHVLLDFLVLGIVSFVVLFSIGLALRFCPPVLGLPLLVVAQGYCQSLNRALAAGWEASCKYVAALLLLGGAAYLVHGAFLEAGGSPWQVKRGSELLFFGFLASPDQPILLTLVNCSLPAYQGVDYSKSRLRIAPLLRPLEKVMLVANSICLTASFVSNILLFSTQDARYSPKDLRVLQAIACVQLFLTSVVVSVLHLLPRCLKDAHSYWMPLGSAAGGSSHLPQHHASSSHHASANRAPPRPSASVPPSPAPPMLAASVVDVAEHYEYVQHILARGQSVSQEELRFAHYMFIMRRGARAAAAHSRAPTASLVRLLIRVCVVDAATGAAAWFRLFPTTVLRRLFEGFVSSSVAAGHAGVLRFTHQGRGLRAEQTAAQAGLADGSQVLAVAALGGSGLAAGAAGGSPWQRPAGWSMGPGGAGLHSSNNNGASSDASGAGVGSYGATGHTARDGPQGRARDGLEGLGSGSTDSAGGGSSMGCGVQWESGSDSDVSTQICEEGEGPWAGAGAEGGGWRL